MPLRAPAALAPLLPSGVLPITQEELCLAYEDGRTWRLLEAFDFASQVLEKIIHVPEGFETDFASVPRPLWALIPPCGTYGKAAVVHDYCYRTAGVCTRGDADSVFDEAMEALGVSYVLRKVIYWGVRVGGSSAYKGGL